MIIHVLIIQTDSPDVYRGPRISLHNGRAKALEDLAKWLEECCGDVDADVQALLDDGQTEAAADLYFGMNQPSQSWPWRIEGMQFDPAPPE